MPTSPMAMPTGTRASISANRETKPIRAMRSLLISLFHRLLFEMLVVQRFRPEGEAPGADRDQDHGADVADPGDRREGPGGDVQVEGLHVVAERDLDLVEEGVRLHGHHEQ